jgi:hypothetical protein
MTTYKMLNYSVCLSILVQKVIQRTRFSCRFIFFIFFARQIFLHWSDQTLVRRMSRSWCRTCMQKGSPEPLTLDNLQGAFFFSSILLGVAFFKFVSEMFDQSFNQIWRTINIPNYHQRMFRRKPMHADTSQDFFLNDLTPTPFLSK